MRNAFASEITEIAAEDKNIVLLSGDIGNRLFDKFKEKYSDRFFNCGVAEANMTGLAAGMAMCGLKPITYSIAPFNTVRCLEQIKIDVCYHNLPVVIVGVGAGLSYVRLGATHHGLEDIAIMRTLPNMTVICPADAVEVRLALRSALRHHGPVYMRLGKKNEPIVHQREPHFVIGKGIVVCEGRDVCLLSTGNMLPVAVEAASILQNTGISAQVVSMHTVKPLDTDLLGHTFATFNVVATIEEHHLAGGLGSSVAEWLADHFSPTGILCRIAIKDQFLLGTGHQDSARNLLGLTSEKIAFKVMRLLSDRYGKVGDDGPRTDLGLLEIQNQK
jgi:transketolase